MAGSYIEAHKYSAPDSLLPLLFGVGTVTIVCGLLWYFPLFIARKILPPSTTEIAQTPVFDNWFTVGCSLIGVWVLVKAIPTLVSYVLGNYFGKRFFPDMVVVNPDWVLFVSFYVFQIVVGLWLFMGGNGLKKVLHWARNS